MSIIELIVYYASLLIIEYNGLPDATAFIQNIVAPLMAGQMESTIQNLAFSDVAASGTFTLTYGSDVSGNLNWNASLAQIQAQLNDIVTPAEVVSISGSIASKAIQIVFTNAPDFELLVATSSLENGSSTPVSIVVTGNTDLGPLPLQIQNAFDIATATGTQLQILGKYAGVSNTGYGFQGQTITLDDTDFATLIRLATITNNSGSDLASIQNLLHIYFPGEIFVFDYQEMRLAYSINSSIGSQNLVQLFVTQGLLPKPMGVQLSTPIYGPILTNFFGLVTYDNPTLYNASGINTYDVYENDTPMLTYDNGVL